MICSDGIHYDSTGGTLQSISNQTTKRPPGTAGPQLREQMENIPFPQCQGTDGNILHEGIGLWESHWDSILYLWWAGAKRNKTSIIFRAGKPKLATQIINLKGHFILLQWTQMLHFTLGKRYF